MKFQSEDCIVSIRRNALKRGFDVFFSIAALLLLSPLIALLMVLISCTDPGPIFYRSRRLGQGGAVIECLKFRTMYCDAEHRLRELLSSSRYRTEWTTYQKFKSDPRVTPLGKFLRRTSLDELPQFWNVLKGDLSIVGPRPPALMGPPEQFLQEIQAVYGDSAFTILSVKPGMTGIWQISGRSNVSLSERRKMEEQYVKSSTLWTDLKVIAKTIPAVLFAKGAC